MKVVHDAIRYPVTTTVGVLLLTLFGVIALYRIPIQLTPTVEEPEVSISTRWPGASPYEIEREIIDEQEEQLKAIEGLRKMESSAREQQSEITLTFQVGTDLDTAVLKVSNRLEQVPSYPPDVDKPVIRTVNIRANAMAWFMLQPTEENGFEGDITTLFDFLDDFVKPEFERVEGVAASNIFIERERELHVIVDPAKLAARRVTFRQLADALERENRNYSGGDFDEGKRRYIVRTVGEYASPEAVEDVVIAVRNGVPIYVRDVGHAELGFRKPRGKVYFFGEPSMAVNVVKQANSNVLDVMAEVREQAARLNAELLKPRGLRLTQVYDQTNYINSAIELVQQNLFVGGCLAVAILLFFLRSFTSTLVVAVAIPISVVGTFLMMNWFERTINVVSLAGMAFAVGMVVDNSIVVLENIYRHRQMGKPRYQAAYDGAREVWGAVLASTLTTIAVFVPVVFVQQEAGQLFRDIAIAISCAVGLSLIVAITVIPSMSAKILHAATGGHGRFGIHNLFGLVRLAERFTNGLTSFVYWLCGGVMRRLAVVVVLTAASVGLSVWLMPKTEYLPQGNNNFLFGFLQPPPGYNIEETASFRHEYDRQLSHLWTTPPEDSASLPGGGIGGYFFVGLADQPILLARARDPLRARELIPEFQKVVKSFPGTFGGMIQRSIFATGGRGAGRNIDIELSGDELERLVGLGGQVFGRLQQALPGAQARPIPSLDLGNPEVRLVTHRRRAAEAGVTHRDLGFTVSALVDGARASDYQYEGRELDLMVKSTASYVHRTHLLEQLPITTPDGRLITLGSIADVQVVNGPASINHRERQRSITIQVTPPVEIPLQEAMETIEADVLAPLRASGQLGGLYQARLAGTADKLSQTVEALKWNFLLALVITYLLMAALFESFLYPFVIMFSVPVAALGGFLGLALLNEFQYQALDVLTMLGFVILIGTVVNNAILIVHQSLNHMREDQLAPREAIRESTRTRIRPIFMSVTTSVCGMMPLVLFPGAGSELYRGLGSVVVGGLVVSTVFTIFLVPALFSLVLDARNATVRGLRVLSGKTEQPVPGD